MAMDWSIRPWWLRPLVALAGGIGGGLLLIWLMSFLPDAGALAVIIVALILGFTYSVWALWDLRRIQREMKVKMAEWESLEVEHRNPPR